MKTKRGSQFNQIRLAVKTTQRKIRTDRRWCSFFSKCVIRPNFLEWSVSQCIMY